ncbi:MAG: RNA polymerase sigma factor SigZ [Verrucomicrobia bacterium]|nr:RNA polymerase sigma factor SigZ [Verrucomicrobiota bacterium]
MTPTVESIWNEFAAKLGRFIATRVADPATAEDILQDVFLKIQTRLDQLQDPTKLQGWLYLMARNAIIDHYRAVKETTPVPESLPADPPERDAEIEELKAAFRGMIHSLPEPYREALLLTEFEGMTQKEMAARLGLSLSGAKSRVQRGREQLKAMLLERCEFEFDRLGRIIDCTPRRKGACQECA